MSNIASSSLPHISFPKFQICFCWSPINAWLTRAKKRIYQLSLELWDFYRQIDPSDCFIYEFQIIQDSQRPPKALIIQTVLALTSGKNLSHACSSKHMQATLVITPLQRKKKKSIKQNSKSKYWWRGWGGRSPVTRNHGTFSTGGSFSFSFFFFFGYYYYYYYYYLPCLNATSFLMAPKRPTIPIFLFFIQ